MPPAAFPAFALAAEASFGAQAAGAASRRQVAPWPCSRTHPYAPLGKAPVAFPSRSLRTGRAFLRKLRTGFERSAIFL